MDVQYNKLDTLLLSPILLFESAFLQFQKLCRAFFKTEKIRRTYLAPFCQFHRSIPILLSLRSFEYLAYGR
jgi:hypothetical protein